MEPIFQDFPNSGNTPLRISKPNKAVVTPTRICGSWLANCRPLHPDVFRASRTRRRPTGCTEGRCRGPWPEF